MKPTPQEKVCAEKEPEAPSTENARKPSAGLWYFPPLVMQLADGSYLLKPGRPIQRATARETAKMTKLSPKTLARLAEAGFIRRAMPTPRLPMYFPAEVIRFIRQTEKDPDFWTEERRKQFGLARLRKK